MHSGVEESEWEYGLTGESESGKVGNRGERINVV